jgi:CDP-paratose 2-epimerase
VKETPQVALITGGAGFVGTNTADRLLASGRRVRILDDLSRPGVERNLRWLERRHPSKLEVEIGDIRDPATARRSIRGAAEVFHFAAQVAVTTSLESPLADAATNVQGTLNLLEEARARPHPPRIVFTSTNKVYGSLEDLALRETASRYEPADPALRAAGICENRPLAFCTPYGCSKGAADQYVLDWANSYGVPTVVLRMSCIYGPHQFGTEDQGWVAHFVISAIEGQPITIYGDGKQVRDILYVEDLVDALLLARDHSERFAGCAFNMGGGAENAISLLELLDELGKLRDEEPEVRSCGWRPGDQRYYVSNTSRFRAATGWCPAVSAAKGLALLNEWLSAERVQSKAAA